ncbi:MAG: UDP-N-acetylmuramoyl-L-alanine--D-glutamate ligase [Acidobacteriota bacterium]
MEMIFSVANKHVVVIGAGRSGSAAAALLVSRGARVTLADSGQTPPGDASRLRGLGVTIELGVHRPDLTTSADLVVVSPGVPPTVAVLAAARRAGVPVIGEVELASRWLAGRVVAVTGTKGKSTTTTLAARMLQEGGIDVTAGGNLGTALSTQVDGSSPEAIHVVEVSSFQLESTDTFHPWIAVLVNLSPDHLDRHASFAEYAAAKARIFRNQTEADWAVVNADDSGAMELAAGTRARRFDFALEAPIQSGVTIEGDQIVRRNQGSSVPLVPVAAVRLPGRHLLADVLAATAVSALAAAPAAAMTRAVEGFMGLEHVLELAGDIDDVRFVNDSKATNIAAAGRAIESFDRHLVVIMGGRYKGGAFEDLREVVRDRVDAVVTIGEAQDRIADALGAVTPVYHASSMDDAVRRGFALTSPGGVVLLAPACSSFDMFSDYAARGRAFKESVSRLAAEVRPTRA